MNIRTRACVAEPLCVSCLEIFMALLMPEERAMCADAAQLSTSLVPSISLCAGWLMVRCTAAGANRAFPVISSYEVDEHAERCRVILG